MEKTTKKTTKKTKAKITKKAKPKLSIKEMELVLAFLELGGNKTKAYMRVFPSASYDSARTTASQKFAKPNIKAWLQDFYDQRWENRKEAIGKTFDNLLKLANSDISDVAEYEDGVLTIKNFEDVDTFAIQEVKQSESHSQYGKNTNQSIKLYDKQKAIADLMKALGMVNNLDIEGDIIIVPAKRPRGKEENNNETESNDG